MEEVLGISRKLQKPPPSPAEPSTSKPAPATPAEPEEEGTIRVQKKDLRRMQCILKDILAGKKVRISTGASSQDVPFEVPSVQPVETNCQLCCQSFKSSRNLRHHLKTYMGDTGCSCSRCSKILSSRAMLDLHLNVGRRKGTGVRNATGGILPNRPLLLISRPNMAQHPQLRSSPAQPVAKYSKLLKP